MKWTQLLFAVVLGVICVGAGIVIGRAQPEGALIVESDEVEGRLEAILAMPDPRLRARGLSTFFSHLVPVHLELVRKVYDQHRFDVDAVAEVLFADWWARFDPLAALEGRIRPVWAAGDDPWVEAVVSRWVQIDPASALLAVQQLGQQPQSVQYEAYRALVNRWFEQPEADPISILRLFDHIRAMEVRGELYSVWAYRMVEARGAESALEIVERFPEDEESMRVKREMMGRVAGVVATRDPQAAIAFATRNANSEAGTKLAYYLVSEWSRSDGSAAIEWATTLRSRTGHKVVERGWRNFVSQDPDAAVAWMERQANSKFLEPAYALFLQRLAAEDYSRALLLAGELRDERRRLQVYQAIGRSWIVRDPEGARTWMATVDLPSEIEKRILALAPRAADGPPDPES